MVSHETPGNTCNQCGTQLKYFEPCSNCFLSFWEIREDIPMRPRLRQITKHQAQMHTEDTTKLHVISLAARAGWVLFSTDIEYRNFHPDTPFNEAYELMWVVWDSNMYQIMSVPINALSVAKTAAARYELEMKDGYPSLIRFQGLPSVIQGMMVTVPKQVIPHQLSWAQDRLGRMGMPLQIEHIQVDLFPLSGPTVKTMEASRNSTGKYKNRTVEFEEREKLMGELKELL